MTARASLMEVIEESSEGANQGGQAAVQSALKEIDSLMSRIQTERMFPDSLREKGLALWTKALQGLHAWVEKLQELPADLSKATEDQLVELIHTRCYYLFLWQMLTGGEKRDSFSAQFLVRIPLTKQRRPSGLPLTLSSAQQLCIQFGCPFPMSPGGKFRLPQEFKDAFEELRSEAAHLLKWDEKLQDVWKAIDKHCEAQLSQVGDILTRLQGRLEEVAGEIGMRDNTVLQRLKTEFGITNWPWEQFCIGLTPDMGRHWKAWIPPSETEFLGDYEAYDNAYNTLQEVAFNVTVPVGCCSVA